MEQLPYDLAAKLEAPPRESSEPGVFVNGANSLVAAVLRGWLYVYHRLVIVGRQNLPTDRSFIVVANHASHLDTLCLQAALAWSQLPRTFAVAAQDYFCVNPLRGFLARLFVNVVPFDRQVAPWNGLDACARRLERRGTVLILFPEGTRGGGAEPGEFKQGVGLLTAGHDVPVVPCHLAGTHAALPKGAWCPRPRAVRLTIGVPRVFAHLPATKASRMHICRELRDAVMQLGKIGL